MSEDNRIDQSDQTIRGSQTNIAKADKVIIRESASFATPPIPHQIPLPPLDFTGRDEELQELLGFFDRGTVVISLRGMGGVGKSALAFALAERLKDRFPDGQLFISMLGTSPKPLTPQEAMAQVIRSYQPTLLLPQNEAELANLYRSVLDSKRALLLLDNAFDEGQVRSLFPPAKCCLIVTSRHKFSLPGMVPINLDILKLEKAVELLLKTARPGYSKPLPQEEPTWKEIARMCGCLPVALRAAGSFLANTPDSSPKQYIKELQDERKRLGMIGKEGVEEDVVTKFSLSYNRLAPETAQIFRLLSIFPADFDAQAEEAICQDEGHRHLIELVRWSLVEFQRPSSEDEGRYHLHDLVRLFAIGRLAEAGGETAENDARQRQAQHYLTVLSDADKLYLKGEESLRACMVIFDLEWKNIQAGQLWAEKNAMSNEIATALCSAYPLEGFYLLGLRQHPQERIKWLMPALNAARQLKDRRSEGSHLGSIGRAYAHMGENRKAIGYYEQHLAISREVEDRKAEGWALDNIGSAYRKLGNARKATDYCRQHLVIAREIKDRRGEGTALGNIGQAYASMGENCKAIGYYEQHLAISREMKNPRGERDALGNLGEAYAALGDSQKAISYYEKALEICSKMSDKRGKGDGLSNMGAAYGSLGRPREAIDYCEQALKNSREIGDRQREGEALGKMGTVYFRLGEARKAIDYFEQALFIACEIGDRRGEGNQLGNLANAYTALAETHKAIEYYQQAIAIDHEIEDARGEVADLGNLGNAHLVLGEVQKAIEYNEKALIIARNIGEKGAESALLGNLGLAYLNISESREAIEYYESGLAIALDIGDKWREASHLGNIGNSCFMMGEVLKAIDYYERALKVACEIGDRRNEGIWLAALGEAFEKLGQLEKAIEFTKAAYEIFKQIESPYAEQARKKLAEWQGDNSQK